MIFGRLPGPAAAPKQRIISARTGHRRAPSTGGCLDTPETHLTYIWVAHNRGISVRDLRRLVVRNPNRLWGYTTTIASPTLRAQFAMPRGIRRRGASPASRYALRTSCSPGGADGCRTGKRISRHADLAHRPRAGDRDAQDRVRAGPADQGRTGRAGRPGTRGADLCGPGRRHPRRPRLVETSPTPAGLANHLSATVAARAEA